MASTESEDTMASADVVAADPNKPSLANVANDVILVILESLGPRSVKRFGATCKGYKCLAESYIRTTEYGLLLTRSAFARLRTVLFDAHKTCSENDTGALAVKVGSYVDHMAATLVMCQPAKKTTEWSRADMISFLYPLAIGLSSGWVLAPYAFEWCALFERDARPRRELLALLHSDALKRLGVLAKEDKWAMGVTLTTAAAAVRHGDLVRGLSRMALESATGEGQAILCLATAAAAAVHLSPGCCNSCGGETKTRAPAWSCLLNTAPKLALPEKAAPEDFAWLHLTGLAPDSERSPMRLMKAFDCRSGELRERRDNPINMLASLIVLMTMDETPARPVVVPVPDALLGEMLAHAVDGRAEDDGDDGPPALDP